jgi:hypothetical protein
VKRPSKPLPLWIGLLLAAAALVYLPFKTGLEVEEWGKELRRTGVPAQGYVYDRITRDSRTTMYFRYQAGGVTYEQEVGCKGVCLEPGATPRIWYNQDDPLDFVTDFGETSGHRGRFQGVMGAGGFVLFVFAVFGIVTAIGTAAHFRRLVVVVGPRREFADGRPARRAETSAEAVALLEELRGRHIHELWLDTVLGPGDTIWPVVEWLQDQAYTGPRPDIEAIVLHSRGAGSDRVIRALREWAYEVRERPETDLIH